jgi:hypothetical protein
MVDNFLIDLKHAEFDTKVSQIDYDSQKEKVKVTISRSREFTYNDIKPEIESIWSYLNEEGFEIEHFTCVEYWEDFEEPEDEFTIHQKGKGYHWSTDEDGKIKSIDTEFQKRPSIRIQPRHDPDNFDRIQKWIFEISFTKDKIKVDKTRGHLTTNEELNPQTYLSAADKLTKLGHIKRPEQLKAWSETIKQREIEATHKKALEEAKKLGQFQLRFVGIGSEIRFANCYIQLYFNSDYYLTEMLPEWLDGDRDSLWPQFMFGVHPVSEEDLEVLDWFSGGIKGYTNSRNGIIWLQDIYINLTNQKYKDEDGVKLPMASSGAISIEGSDFSEVYFSNRREAIKFRNLLVSLFEGDIDYIQPNRKDFKEDILETWCEHDERPVELSELEDFIDKLRMTRLNSLYRD